MPRPSLAVTLLLAGLLSACIRDEPAPRRAPTPTSVPTTTVAVNSAAASSLEVEVAVEGRYERGVTHTIRVERPDGKQVFERVLGPDRRLREPLAPGDYRVLSYQRQCKAACGAKPQPRELSEPIDVCGSYFAVRAETPTRAVVMIVPQEGCTITLS